EPASLGCNPMLFLSNLLRLELQISVPPGRVPGCPALYLPLEPTQLARGPLATPCGLARILPAQIVCCRAHLVGRIAKVSTPLRLCRCLAGRLTSRLSFAGRVALAASAKHFFRLLAEFGLLARELLELALHLVSAEVRR